MAGIVPSLKPVFDGPLNLPLRAKVRCAACQLQICKSRLEPPHGALQQTARDEHANSKTFACDNCHVSLVWCGDTRSPGWSQQR